MSDKQNADKKQKPNFVFCLFTSFVFIQNTTNTFCRNSLMKVAKLENLYCIAKLLRGNRVMNSALACCADSPGLIPAIGKSNVQYSDGFHPSWY